MPIYMTIILFFIFLTGCTNNPDRPLRVAIHNWIGYQSLTLAQQQGALVPQKVRIVTSSSLSESSQKLRSGQVDAAALTLDEVLTLRDQGVSLTVVLVFDDSFGADLLLARSSIKSLHDLKGKTIGLEDSALGHLMLHEALKRGNLTPDQVSLEYIIVEEHSEAWARGNLDALITYLPLPENVLTQTTCLFDSHDIPNTIVDVLAVRTERLQMFERELKYLIGQHFKMTKKIRLSSQDILFRLAGILNMPEQDISTVLRKITFPNETYNRQLLQKNHPLLMETVAKLSEIMIPAGFLSAVPNLADLTDDSLIPRNGSD